MPNPYYYMSKEQAPYKTGNEKPEIDMLSDLIEGIKNNPEGRRHMLATYFVPATPYQALPPCHSFGQFYVADGKISFKWFQRSWDLLLGAPFNIASYALLLNIVAQQTGFTAHELVATATDAHIYSNHIEQVQLQLSRQSEAYLFPNLIIKRKPESIFDYKYDDFEIVGYNSHPAIKAPIAV